jgi:hypothetical protein
MGRKWPACKKLPGTAIGAEGSQSLSGTVRNIIELRIGLDLISRGQVDPSSKAHDRALELLDAYSLSSHLNVVGTNMVRTSLKAHFLGHDLPYYYMYQH